MPGQLDSGWSKIIKWELQVVSHKRLRLELSGDIPNYLLVFEGDRS